MREINSNMNKMDNRNDERQSRWRVGLEIRGCEAKYGMQTSPSPDVEPLLGSRYCSIFTRWIYWKMWKLSGVKLRSKANDNFLMPQGKCRCTLQTNNRPWVPCKACTPRHTAPSPTEKSPRISYIATCAQYKKKPPNHFEILKGETVNGYTATTAC